MIEGEKDPSNAFSFEVISAKEPSNQRLFCGKRPATEGIPWVFSIL